MKTNADIINYQTLGLCIKVKNDGSADFETFDMDDNKTGFAKHKQSGDPDKYKPEKRLTNKGLFTFQFDYFQLWGYARGWEDFDDSVDIAILSAELDNLVGNGLQIWLPK